MHMTNLKHVRLRAQAANVSRRARGVSMIEVLVSIVIASIGLLALAGVNAAAVRLTKMSQYRATATLLANDIGERMRANKAGFVAGSYDFTSDFSGQATKPTLTASELCNVAGGSCTTAQIANLDLKQWRMTVRDQLPSGSVFLLRAGAQNSADVWVVWRDPVVASTAESPALATECPDGLNTGSDVSIRCSFFRVAL